VASVALARLPPLSGGERLGAVAGEKHDVGWGPAGDLGDRGGDGRWLPAPVVRVVLEQALDLPGPPLASQLSAWARKHSLEADPATALAPSSPGAAWTDSSASKSPGTTHP
jgi:hypothetical protein